MKPLVSILVPAYNSERWIADTLEIGVGADVAQQGRLSLSTTDRLTALTVSPLRVVVGQVVSQRNGARRRPEPRLLVQQRRGTFSGSTRTICWHRTRSRRRWQPQSMLNPRTVASGPWA
jgi:hypothetical protein